MAQLPRSAFRRRLWGLDAAGFERFVADLWRARGYVVDADGERLVVEHPTSGGPRTIAVRTVPRWRRRAPAPDPSGADAVVLNRPAPGRQEGVIDVDDLHDMVQYAIAPEARAALRAEHPLDAGGSLIGRAFDRFPPRRHAVVSVALVVLVAAAVGVALLPLDGPAPADQGAAPVPGTDRPGSAVVTDDATAEGVGETQQPVEAAALPPGLAASGISDPEALAAAHARVVRDRAYRLALTARALADGREVGSYEEQIAVRSDWTFATAVETTGEPPTDHPTIAGVDLFSAGNGLFVRPAADVDRRPPPTTVDDLERRVERYLASVLSVEASSIVRTTSRSGRALYRVNGTDREPGGSAETVSALVTSTGAVHAVRLERRAPGTHRTLVVTLTYTYGPVSVFPPTWAGNTSALVERPATEGAHPRRTTGGAPAGLT